MIYSTAFIKGEWNVFEFIHFFLQGYTKLFPCFWWTKNFPQRSDSHNCCTQEEFWICRDNLSKWEWNLARTIFLMYWSWPCLWLPFSKMLLWYRHCFCCVLKLSIGVNRRVRSCLLGFTWEIFPSYEASCKSERRWKSSCYKVLLFSEAPSEKTGIPYHTDSRSIKASVCITITVARRAFSWTGTVKSFLASLQWKNKNKVFPTHMHLES